MNIKHLKLYRFRNYQKFNFSFSNGIHIFTGNNAQGKTNILEAIFLAVLGKSFRAGKDEEMIRWEDNEAIIEVDFDNIVSSHFLKIELFREDNRKNYLNGQIISKRNIVGHLNAVLFCPEDLWLIKGGPAARRRFIDFLISQVDRLYYNNYINFNRVILHRNNLLKEIIQNKSKEKYLDVWDEQLIDLADKIYIRRTELLKSLLEISSQIYAKISCGAENFSAHYLVFGQEKSEEISYRAWYKNVIEKGRTRDIHRGATEFGPHKDDIAFVIDGHEAKVFGSQGQQRTIILSLKLAELEIMKQIRGENPILLLDDVMSELDDFRRKRLIQEIDGKIQTFITGTEKETALKEISATFYSVSNGSVALI